MKKKHAIKKPKKIRGTAYELIGIMTIISCQAIERGLTPHAKWKNTILDIYKDKKFIKKMRAAFAHNRDLSILARNFSTFIRVVERVGRGEGRRHGN
ncbi:MAG TPA: hypothetical protein PK590_05110 [Candidatus Omnitrophota bacterium]|nr:hypothetical protein [Candidatus Omnitrophota bacterium]